MRALTVLYDGGCPFCVRCALWLARSRQRIPLVPVDCTTEIARARYGRIRGLGRELVVVDDEGRWWVGPAAFLMCLWALEFWNPIASLLLLAPIRPFAIEVFARVTAHRATLASLLGMPPCEGHCDLAHAHVGPYR